MAERWRWRATGWLIFDDGSRTMIAFDRPCEGSGEHTPDALVDLVEAVNRETTWDLDRVVIELRSYVAGRSSSQRANASGQAPASAPFEPTPRNAPGGQRSD